MLDKETESATWDDIDWGEGSIDEAPASSDPLKVNGEGALGEQSAVVRDQAERGAIAAGVLLEQIDKRGDESPVEDRQADLDSGVKQASRSQRERSGVLSGQPEMLTQDVTSKRTKPTVYAPASVATLTILDKGEPAAVVPIDATMSVGRGEDNQLVIMDLHVSTHHAILELLANGSFEVVDLGSTGGTFVNGTAVKRRILGHRDRITFSTIHTVFEYLGGVESAEPSSDCKTITPMRVSFLPKLKVGAQEEKTAALTFDDGIPRVLPADERISVGRNKENHIILKEPHISGSHAQLVRFSNGAYHVVDLDSTCGTFLNGVRVTSRVIKHGDKITFGVLECTFTLS